MTDHPLYHTPCSMSELEGPWPQLDVCLYSFSLVSVFSNFCVS
ncbi:unnamed protein product, partial [Gulo gulo]